MTAVVAALAVAVLLLAVLVAGLLRSHAEILRSLQDLGAGLELDRGVTGPVGLAAPRTSILPPELSGHTLDGSVSATSLRGQNTLIAFLSSGCTTCQEFWKAFRDERPEVPGDAQLVVVTRGLEQESAAALQDRLPATVPLLLSDEAWEAFEVPGAPYFVYLDPAGEVVGEGTGTSWKQIVTMITEARADAALLSKGGGAARDRRDLLVLHEAGIEPGDPSLYTP